jgi:HEAT repeat protein
MTTMAHGSDTDHTGLRVRIAPPVTPPTRLGREGSAELVEAGYDLARRAIGKALERVPVADAVHGLTELAEHRDEVLRMAEDYLGYTTFDVPLTAQVGALALVEDARTRLAAATPRRSWFRRSH